MRPTFVFLDTETTGLSRENDEIISIAFILLDEKLKEIKRAAFYAMPTVPVSPEAAKVNGFTKELWEERGATTQALLVQAVDNFLPKDRVTAVGHNVDFDLSFTRKLLTARVFNTRFYRHSLDTLSLSIFCDLLHFGKKSNSYTLENLCTRFGISNRYAHDAASDVQATLELFLALKGVLPGNSSLVPPLSSGSAFIKIANQEWTVTRGKHKGRTLLDVSIADPSYLLWMQNNISDLSAEQVAAIKSAAA